METIALVYFNFDRKSFSLPMRDGNLQVSRSNMRVGSVLAYLRDGNRGIDMAITGKVAVFSLPMRMETENQVVR